MKIGLNLFTYILCNPDKTTCTLFTPDPAKYNSNLGLHINNRALPMALHPKVLGLTLYPKLTYNAHIQNIATHAQKPLQVIKALTGTTWGKQKETLVATYKAVMRPTLEYGTHEHTTQHLFSCPQIPTTLSALDLWRDPSGVAALLDDWREKLAANPHQTTEADSPQ